MAFEMNVKNRDRFAMKAADPAATDAELQEVVEKGNAEAAKVAESRLKARKTYSQVAGS